MTCRSLVAALLGMTAALCACGHPAQDAGADTTTSAAATDTIVRRVLRHQRLPSAMQRVTRELHVLQALRPLDSSLAVRVMDQRGRELAGVRVSWTLQSAGDGAQLRVINARTDTGGISRVAFTPGRTGLPQTIVADVAGVGRIGFPVIVPVAAIRVTAARMLWSGDEAVVDADLRDAAGVELLGGPLIWGTTDSTILKVTSSDQRGARVIGRLPGAADVVAWIEPGTVRGHSRMSIRPVVSGTLLTLDGQPLPAATVEISAGTMRDALTVTEGRFSKRVDVPALAEVDLRVEPAPAAPYHITHLRFTSERPLQDMRIALVPTTWRIDAGTHSGTDVPIDAARALRRTAAIAPFWRVPPVRARVTSQLLGWEESAFPLRIAFNRSRSIEPITAADSIAFWRVAKQMEADLGGRYFTPAQADGDSIPIGMIAVEVARNVSAGHTFVTWNHAGDAYDGTLMFRSASTLGDAHIVTHELLHLLGFGHATSFRSVSQAVGGTEPRLTVEDVAYAQVALRLRRIGGPSRALPGLPIAGR